MLKTCKRFFKLDHSLEKGAKNVKNGNLFHSAICLFRQVAIAHLLPFTQSENQQHEPSFARADVIKFCFSMIVLNCH